jgi:hypothetical protein
VQPPELGRVISIGKSAVFTIVMNDEPPERHT